VKLESAYLGRVREANIGIQRDKKMNNLQIQNRVDEVKAELSRGAWMPESHPLSVSSHAVPACHSLAVAA